MAPIVEPDGILFETQFSGEKKTVSHHSRIGFNDFLCRIIHWIELTR